jgi:hypothetical protein
MIALVNKPSRMGGEVEVEVSIWVYPPKSNINFAFGMLMGSEVRSFWQNITSDRSFVGPRTKFWPKLRLQTKKTSGLKFMFSTDVLVLLHIRCRWYLVVYC